MTRHTSYRSIDPANRPRLAALLRLVPMLLLLSVSGCGWLSDRFTASEDPSLRLARVFLASGAGEAALRATEEVLRRQPRDIAALETRGDAFAMLGQFTEAQETYRMAMMIDPRAISPRIALGRMLVRIDPASAEAVFLEVLARQPRNAVALNNLGVSRDLQGRHVEAQQSYRSALAADSGMTGASVNLGLSLVLSGNTPEAVQTLRPIAAGPAASDTVTQNLAIALTANGQTTEAEQLLSRSMPAAEIGPAIDSYRQIAGTHPSSLPSRTAPPVAAPLPRHSSSQVLPTRPIVAISSAPLPPTSDLVPAPVLASARPDLRADPAPPRLTTANYAPAPRASAPADVPLAIAPAPVAAAPPSPLPTAPEVIARAPMSGPETAPIAPPADATSYAQLTTAPSAAKAITVWEGMRGRLADLLGDREPVVVPGTIRGQPGWLLRTGPLAAQAAESLCAQLRASGQDCRALTPVAATIAARASPQMAQPGLPLAAITPAARITAIGEPTPVVASQADGSPTPPIESRAGAPTPDVGPIATALVTAPTPLSVPGIEPEPARRAYVQFAAAESAMQAEAEWRRLRNRIASVLQDHQPLTQPAEVGGRLYWRLRTGPFPAVRDAEAFCAEVRAAGNACWATTAPIGG